MKASPRNQKPASAQRAAEERVTPLKTRSNYRQFYGFAKNAHLAISRETGLLLYMPVRSTGARAIVDFGTSFGISSLHLAAALRDNGGGHLITTEFEPFKVVRARENFVAGGLSDLIEIREGDALETLGRDLPDHIRPGTARRREGTLSCNPQTPRGTIVARSFDRGRQR